jgi:hypothetical protein
MLQGKRTLLVNKAARGNLQNNTFSKKSTAVFATLFIVGLVLFFSALYEV